MWIVIGYVGISIVWTSLERIVPTTDKVLGDFAVFVARMASAMCASVRAASSVVTKTCVRWMLRMTQMETAYVRTRKALCLAPATSRTTSTPTIFALSVDNVKTTRTSRVHSEVVVRRSEMVVDTMVFVLKMVLARSVSVAAETSVHWCTICARSILSMTPTATICVAMRILVHWTRRTMRMQITYARTSKPNPQARPRVVR